MIKAVLENYNGAPAIMINGKPYPPMMGTVTAHVGTETVVGQEFKEHGVEYNEEYIKKLGESGIRIFFLICDTEWLIPGAFELFKTQAETILQMIP